MARLRRDGPYFWVTWLTKLLTGENSCEWAAWFRARHESGSWEQVPGDFDRAGWQMAHTAMVNDSRERWEELGCTVFTERQNSLRLRGRIRHPGRPAGPDCQEGCGGHHHRRKDREARPSPHSPGDAVHVRRAQGHRAAP